MNPPANGMPLEEEAGEARVLSVYMGLDGSRACCLTLLLLLSLAVSQNQHLPTHTHVDCSAGVWSRPHTHTLRTHVQGILLCDRGRRVRYVAFPPPS